jgi:hypothetical protein
LEFSLYKANIKIAAKIEGIAIDKPLNAKSVLPIPNAIKNPASTAKTMITEK